MSSKTILFALLLLQTIGVSQTEIFSKLNVNYFQFNFNNTKVDVLVKSKKGEENLKKPLLVFCQGSMPVPLILKDSTTHFLIGFPFNTDSLTKKFHLVIISKPKVPLVESSNKLNSDFTIQDTSLRKEYSKLNLLSYYSQRNNFVIKELLKKNFTNSKMLVLAGHSEGSTIVAEMTKSNPLVTHLIYSGGNPYGRIVSIVNKSRTQENDSVSIAEEEFRYWEDILNHPNDIDISNGDTYKTTYQFSQPQLQNLKNFKKPILISYGSKDFSAPYIDLMRIEFARQKIKHISYLCYLNTEHNFFPINKCGEVSHSVFNWDKVATDWYYWLNKHK